MNMDKSDSAKQNVPEVQEFQIDKQLSILSKEITMLDEFLSELECRLERVSRDESDDKNEKNEAKEVAVECLVGLAQNICNYRDKVRNMRKRTTNLLRRLEL